MIKYYELIWKWFVDKFPGKVSKSSVHREESIFGSFNQFISFLLWMWSLTETVNTSKLVDIQQHAMANEINNWKEPDSTDFMPIIEKLLNLITF